MLPQLFHFCDVGIQIVVNHCGPSSWNTRLSCTGAEWEIVIRVKMFEQLLSS